jgi:hypothetical protein
MTPLIRLLVNLGGAYLGPQGQDPSDQVVCQSGRGMLGPSRPGQLCPGCLSIWEGQFRELDPPCPLKVIELMGSCAVLGPCLVSSGSIKDAPYGHYSGCSLRASGLRARTLLAGNRPLRARTLLAGNSFLRVPGRSLRARGSSRARTLLVGNKDAPCGQLALNIKSFPPARKGH